MQVTTFPTSHCATQALFLKSLSQSQAWLFLMKLKSEKRNWEGLLFLASSKRVSIMAQEWAFEDLRKGQKRPLIWRGHHLVMQQLMLHSAILMALFFVCFLRKTLVKFSYTLQFDYFLTVVVFKGKVSHETFFFIENVLMQQKIPTLLNMNQEKFQ